MNFKFLNALVFFSALFLFLTKSNVKKHELVDYYIVEESKEFNNLVYTIEYKDYRDSLYTNVVFN